LPISARPSIDPTIPAATSSISTEQTAAIERFAVLQDGASPIYGSDAIAGGVNIITRSDCEGAGFETNP
jgi:iron complex outermembrane receptor protein